MATKVEKQERVDAVLDLLLQSVSRRGILQYFAKRGWDVRPRTVDWYIAEARKELLELSRHDREEEFGRAVGQLNLMLMQALAKGDLRTARLIRRDLTDLLGLSQATDALRVTVDSEAMARWEKPFDLSVLNDEEWAAYHGIIQKLSDAPRLGESVA